MNAVSIELQDGKVITLMPFASILVHEGQSVAEGAPLGTLAASGDVSSAVPHVHMGYKQGSSYLDPMLLFGAAHAGSPGEGSAERDLGAMAPDGRAVAFAEALGLAEPDFQGVTEVTPNASVEMVAPSQDARVPVEESFGAIETGSYELGQRVAEKVGPFDFLAGAAERLLFACREQAVSLIGALAPMARAVGVPLPIMVGASLVALAGILAMLCLVCAKLVGSRLGEALHRRKTFLVNEMGRW